MQRSHPATFSHKSILALVLMLGLGVASCSLLGHKKKPAPLPITQHTVTMDLAPEIAVDGLVATPPGFTPIVGQPPLWLQGAREIALVGTREGRTEVLGFRGNGYKHRRLVAADGGPGAQHGKIVGLAASPDGLTLAVAAATPGRIDIVLRYVISNAGQSSVASFEGTFHAVSLVWLSASTLAVGLAGKPAVAPAQSGVLYLVHVLGAISVEQVKFTCTSSSTMAFSHDGRFIVSEGDEHTPPSLFDRRSDTCRQIGPDGPIRVLGWAPGDTAILYSTPRSLGKGPGVFRYTIIGRKTELIAVSSSAASYTGAGIVMALGNRGLDPQSAAAAPDRRVTAQLASFLPKQSQTLVDTLGIPTTPAMMMASTMAYSHGYAELALQLFALGPNGPTREIVTFSIIDRKAFVLASGPARGDAVIGWSPAANHLAIFDGDGTAGALAVLTPKR